MFQKQVANVGRINLELISSDANIPFSGNINIQLLDSNGIEKGIQSYDVLNQLTATQINAITNLFTNLRTRAGAESL